MVKSPIKVIKSGTTPTTENLAKGEIAFGTVDGATKLYGSDGTTVSELGGGGGTEVNSIAPAKVSVGAESFDGGSYDSLAIGNNARADLDEVQYHAGSSLAVGNNSIASDQGSTAIGVSSNAISGMAIGYNSRARNNGTALGRTAKAEGLNSVAIGSNSEATLDNELSVGSDSLQRRITHVATPTDAQDAATKNYVDAKVSEIPAGPQGDPGEPGPQGEPGAPGTAATITVGTTTTGEAGTEASVTNSGTTSAAVLNFTIPKGAKGDKGDKGDTGDTGPAGTTTFAGLTGQPTDNAALKTALDAKASQATVDSLTTTVNGKVSSVSAGEGISITGTATEPVISATGGATYALLPDYDNWREITDEVDSNGGWVATDNGLVVVRKKTANDTEDLAIYTYRQGSSGALFGLSSYYISNADTSPSHIWAIVTKGKEFSLPSKGGVNQNYYFIPFKQSTITPNEFTDTGWQEITDSSGSGLKYLTGPVVIPSGTSLKIRKYGKRVSVAGTLQFTEAINSANEETVLNITDDNVGKYMPAGGAQSGVIWTGSGQAAESMIVYKVTGFVDTTADSQLERGLAQKDVQPLAQFDGQPGTTTSDYVKVSIVPFLNTSISNGEYFKVDFSWDTED